MWTFYFTSFFFLAAAVVVVELTALYHGIEYPIGREEVQSEGKFFNFLMENQLAESESIRPWLCAPIFSCVSWPLNKC